MSRPRPLSGPWGAALTGVLAAAAALAAAEVVAAVVQPTASPILAVGGTVIDHTPTAIKDAAIRAFGSHDKTVLLTGIYLVLALFAAGVGLLAGRRLGYGLAGVVAFGGLGVVAAASRPAAGPLDTLPAVVGTLAGCGVLTLLCRARDSIGRAAGDPRPEAAPVLPGGPDATAAGATAVAAERDAATAAGRRRFLRLAAVVGGLSVLGALGARRLALARSFGTRSRASVTLPAPLSPAPVLPAGADLRLPGLSRFYTGNADFYRVDTALAVPQVDAAGWRLKVRGMVDRPVTLSFGQLLGRGLVERDITLNCVSNEVGGPYIGTARWLGVPLAPLLREAGIRPGADQLVSRSTDGMTIGTPIDVVLDGRDAMLAVGMNGEPLPVQHGFPVRMLVPGLYGYVSACKWIVDIEVTTFAAYDAYWVQRGWAQRAPVKTASRIDTPRAFGKVRRGSVTVAGVAWAQHRGISRVEVQVDNGPWREARLAAVPSADTWRQWVYVWDAAPGSHTLRVRATDGTGATQTDARHGVLPDGATGWHEVAVTVA